MPVPSPIWAGLVPPMPSAGVRAPTTVWLEHLPEQGLALLEAVGVDVGDVVADDVHHRLMASQAGNGGVHGTDHWMVASWLGVGVVDGSAVVSWVVAEGVGDWVEVLAGSLDRVSTVGDAAVGGLPWAVAPMAMI